ncbi:hypothetical protein FVE85_2461 [Porphyridium purpureum]|uniref:Protein NUCLEAR FUSION DEFECTIVE 4 n=1 Tax=Porphyridium purpureum TaxID=35688 RepID=A0A5J4YJ60_PORPP|nr:hypothetical protein FVE85_2461 [Porphyridium purpureum]|eukprot:POR1971..scf291_13
MTSMASSAQLKRSRWFGQVPLACLGMFVAGATIAYSVFVTDFTPAIETAFLVGAAYRNVFGGIASVAGGLFWESHRMSVCLIGLLFHLPLLLLPYAVLKDSAALMVWSTALVGAGNSILGLASVLVISKWLGDRPALGMSLSMLANSSGLIVGSKMFSALSEQFHIMTALIVSGVSIGLLALICLVFMCEPPAGFLDPSHEPAQSPSSSAKAKPAHAEGTEERIIERSANAGVRLGIRLFAQKELYKVFVMYGMGQAVGYTVLVSFASFMDDEFGISGPDSASLFGLMNACGLVARVFAGFVAQSLKRPGFFWCGPKNSALIFLLLQTLACVYMALGHALTMYVVCLTVTLICYSIMPIYVLLIAPQLFSPANAGLTFAIANGVACLMCTCFSLGYTFLTLQTHWIFFAVSAVSSLVAFLVTVTLSRCDAAFEFMLPDGRMAVFIESHLLGELDPSSDQHALHDLMTTEAGFELLQETLGAEEHVPHSLEAGMSFGGLGWAPIDIHASLLVGVIKDDYVTEVLQKKLYEDLPTVGTLTNAVIPLDGEVESVVDSHEKMSLLGDDLQMLEIVDWSQIPEEMDFVETMDIGRPEDVPEPEAELEPNA